MSNIRIYSDGFCSRNGAAGWSFAVFNGKEKVFSDNGAIADHPPTQPLADYTALEKALTFVERNLPDKKVNLYVDSELILAQTRGTWNALAHHLIPFRNRCQSLYRENKGVRLYYCKPEDNKAAKESEKTELALTA